MIGALSDQPPLPLTLPALQEPATVAGSPCCRSPYCTGCTVANYLTDAEAETMRRHLARLLARAATRRRP